MTAIVLDVRELSGVGAELLAVIKTPPPALLNAVGAELESQTRRRFVEKKSPGGGKWANWSKKYAKRALGGGKDRPRQLLVRSGRLRDSIGYDVEGEAVRVGSNLVYASAHQEGTPRIPARPYLGLGTQDLDDVRDVVVDWYGKRFGGLS